MVRLGTAKRNPIVCFVSFMICVFLLVTCACLMLASAVFENPMEVGWLKNVHWTPGKLKVDIYDFMINPIDTCKLETASKTLLILVKSAPSHKSRRDVIRETYINGVQEYNLPSRVLFVLGNTEDKREREIIRKEAELYEDILQADFNDHYYNLTIKLIMSLKWVVKFCRNTDFVMSIDDDVMLDVITLVEDLRALPLEQRSGFFLGKPNPYPPNRNIFSKWYIPREIYPSDTYPALPYGHGYVMSHDVVRKIYDASKGILPVVPFDDVYCGMLLETGNIDIVDRPDFFKQLHPTRGSKDYLKTELSEKAMLLTWERMRFESHNENLPRFRWTNEILFVLLLISLFIIIIVRNVHHFTFEHGRAFSKSLLFTCQRLSIFGKKSGSKTYKGGNLSFV